ncbi:solute carrier family 23 protein [uncultured Bacteroides sp.]|uniref:uracil-xanthine permease family protein n=1 Tax=uncultured Bacteroides sp. TaxID=162156 RepID=UPI002AAAF6BF|nr:solute carrier family 23 protein [uncultured Bacteroides sp.]
MSFAPTPLKYKNDDKPGLWPMLMYGLQWFLITIPIVLILSAVVGNFQLGGVAEQTYYTQKLFALTGIGLILQILFGHKMPVVIGPASVLLIGIIATQASQINEVYTAIICGGIILFLLSFSGWIKYLQRIFTVRIIIVILALIAFTLMPTILNLVFADKVHPFMSYAFALIMVFLMLLSNKLLRGIWKSSIVLWGLLFGSLVYTFIIGDLGSTSEQATETSATLSLFIPSLVFDPGILLSFLFCYIALFINELGSLQSVGTAIQVKGMEKRTKMGLRFTGLMNIISGGTGIIGPVDFSLSPGVIMSTGCASRYTLLPAGAALIACAFFPEVITFLSTIPRPVMGVILLYLMTTQLSSAFQLVAQENSIPDFNSCMIIAFPIMIALMVSFMPPTVAASMPHILRPLLANGFVMGVISVLLMEHLVFRKK